MGIFDATANLTQREIKMLEKSWAKYFAENIFPAIDEEPFKILYSDRPPRHNTPVEEDDHNRVLYHNRSEDTESKITQVLKDAVQIITACGSHYDESSEYQLLIRVIGEQTVKSHMG